MNFINWFGVNICLILSYQLKWPDVSEFLLESGTLLGERELDPLKSA